MSCKKWCSNRQAKWILAGSVTVTLVLTVSVVLGLTLHRGTQLGRNCSFLHPAPDLIPYPTELCPRTQLYAPFWNFSPTKPSSLAEGAIDFALISAKTLPAVLLEGPSFPQCSFLPLPAHLLALQSLLDKGPSSHPETAPSSQCPKPMPVLL